MARRLALTAIVALLASGLVLSWIASARSAGIGQAYAGAEWSGGAVWTTPSVDEALGLVYLETGNAVPLFGGEARPGDNLFNVSVVALNKDHPWTVGQLIVEAER